MGDEHRAHEHGFRDKLGVRDLGQLLPQMRGEVNRYGAAGWLLVLHANTHVRALRALQALFSLSPKKRLNPTRNRPVIRDVRWVEAADEDFSVRVRIHCEKPELCLLPQLGLFSWPGRRRAVGA